MMLNWFFFSLAPFLMLSSTFAAYVLFVGAEAFTPEKAFVVILVFNLLNIAIECLPTTVGLETILSNQFIFFHEANSS